MWTTIKNDRKRHLQMLRQELEKEVKQEINSIVYHKWLNYINKKKIKA
jgi:hypothetical protein